MPDPEARRGRIGFVVALIVTIAVVSVAIFFFARWVISTVWP